MIEFFAKVGGGWQSLGIKTYYPASDAAGVQTIDEKATFNCSNPIGDPAGNEFRAVVVASGGGVTTDKITGLPDVTWQVDSSTPTEVALTQAIRATIRPLNA